MGNRYGWKWLAAGALCLLAGAWPAQLSAQSGSAARKRVSDPAAAELNRLLVAAQEAVDQQGLSSRREELSGLPRQEARRRTGALQSRIRLHGHAAPRRCPGGIRKSHFARPQDGRGVLESGNNAAGHRPQGRGRAASKRRPSFCPRMRTRSICWEWRSNGTERARQAIEAVPGGGEVWTQKNAEIQNALGHALLGAGRAGDAEAAFRQALALNPEGAEQARGARRIGAGADGAEEDGGGRGGARDLLARRGRTTRARGAQRAFALADLGKNDEALGGAGSSGGRRAGELADPEAARATVSRERNDYADAIPSLQKAEVLAPREADLSAALGHVYFEKKDTPTPRRSWSRHTI